MMFAFIQQGVANQYDRYNIIITLKRVIFCDDSLIVGESGEPCKACCLTHLLNGCHRWRRLFISTQIYYHPRHISQEAYLYTQEKA